MGGWSSERPVSLSSGNACADAAGAAGYRIFWREAWAPDWQHEMFVGNVTEYTLPHMNVDDWVFGVAAVDADGHESTVSAYVAPPAAY